MLQAGYDGLWIADNSSQLMQRDCLIREGKGENCKTETRFREPHRLYTAGGQLSRVWNVCNVEAEQVPVPASVQGCQQYQQRGANEAAPGAQKLGAVKVG